MKIIDMFENRINRDIKGVIKVGQSDDVNMHQELEEYVVTRELLRHFREFYDNYSKGITGNTDKMGVWISGFFGSGKSHLLKILSYLLKNSEAAGKKALNYFTDGKKIDDAMLIAQMKKAETVPTDVVLFNIDSKGSAKIGSSKEAIVEVFMKVFNEMQGYCGSIPYLAEFERYLDSEGVFNKFKDKFNEITSEEWEKKRQAFAVVQDKVVQTIVAIDFMSEEAARNWCKTAKSAYELSIEKFVSLVKEYLDNKGNNHHIVFLVDEIGQYIAEDIKLMLNLQTITEDLGTACHGKAWVIVTSQEDIDSITKTKGNDFSKIQGRFDTRLSLSAANVDEVIRKRILEKNEAASQTLKLMYDSKESAIKDLIAFTEDTADKRLFADRDDFAEVYPFIPYQFNLLGQVLTAIRTHGASGKHLADGARSMLALFKESAVRLADTNCEEGAIIPFSYFFDPLGKFIDHTHSTVILQATENIKVFDDFDVQVLKILFMVKYVKEIKANVDNLTTLMLSSIDDDRITLRQRVEASLRKLIHETLVQKNGEIYIFLTNEEQEINNSIRQETVEIGEIIAEVQSTIFQDIYTENKYRYSTRYSFPFNQKIDDHFFKGNQSNDIGVHIITPYAEDCGDPGWRIRSQQDSSVIVKLPNDGSFLDEITENIKISKFLNKRSSNDAKSFESIIRAKEDERQEKKDRIKIFIQDALQNADIYVNGNKVTIFAKDPANRINEALGKLVDTRYSKLSYMETAPGLSDISAIFNDNGQTRLIGIADTVPNKLALQEVENIVSQNRVRNIKTSLKSLMDKFMAAPYGFVSEDVQWLVAMLFKLGRFSLSLNSMNISIINNDSAEIARYITKKEYIEKLVIDIRVKANSSQLQSAKAVLKDYFGITVTTDDDDSIMKDFKRYTEKRIKDINDILIEYRINPQYKGGKELENAKKNLEEIYEIKDPAVFYKNVDTKRDDLLDNGDDIAPIFYFFKSEQKEIYSKTCKFISIYEKSRNFISDRNIMDIISQMKAIAEMKSPYSSIQKLPDLNGRFADIHCALLKTEADIMRPIVEDSYNTIVEMLAAKGLSNQFGDKFKKRFDELKNKLEHTNEIADIQNIRLESDNIRKICLNEVSDYEAAHAPQPEIQPNINDINSKPSVAVPLKQVKRTRNLSFGDITRSKIYSIESNADIDKCLSDLREKLVKELEDNAVITLS